MRAAAGLLAAVLTAPVLAHAELLRIEEHDVDGLTQTVRPTPGIVDINSSLSLRLDHDGLREVLLGDHGVTVDPRELETIRKIQDATRRGLDALASTAPALRAYAALDRPMPNDVQTMATAVAAVADPAKEILTYALEQDPALDALINLRLEAIALDPGTPMSETYRTVFEAAAQYVDQRRAQIDGVLRTRGVYVQMGAWLHTAGVSHPIHLPGFDTYPEGEYYEFARWKLAALLSEANAQAFDEAAQTAREINERLEAGADLGRVFGGELRAAAVKGLEPVRECVTGLQPKVEAVQRGAGQGLQAFATRASEARRAVEDYVAFLHALKLRYGNLAGTDPAQVGRLFADLGADYEQLRARTTALRDDLKALAEDIKGLGAGVSAQLHADGQTLATQTQHCADLALAQIRAVQTAAGMLVNGREIAEGSMEYTDKVLRHDLSRLPAETRVDLKTTGRREPGDAVVVRLSAGREAAQGARDLERRDLRLYPVLWHTDVAVSLIFANPSGEMGLSSDFQAAPSYSVLLKRGSRGNTFVNELLTPGIGLNIAALDFNVDQTMEFGVGMTLSLFRDYLQFGGGYNVNESRSYWFFGLAFPLPSHSATGP